VIMRVGECFLLVPAYPGCPGQSPESHETVVCVCVCFGEYVIAFVTA